MGRKKPFSTEIPEQFVRIVKGLDAIEEEL